METSVSSELKGRRVMRRSITRTRPPQLIKEERVIFEPADQECYSIAKFLELSLRF